MYCNVYLFGSSSVLDANLGSGSVLHVFLLGSDSVLNVYLLGSSSVLHVYLLGSSVLQYLPIRI